MDDVHESVRAEEDAAGPVTCEEAMAILQRFNASHFRDPEREHARYSIPANPRYDDDIRLAAFIRQAERALAAADRLAEAVERTAHGPGPLAIEALAGALAAYRAARGAR